MATSMKLKYFATVLTSTQPIKGIKNWKNPNVLAIPIAFGNFIFWLHKPFARETEKASIASPSPKSKLLRKKVISKFILH